MEQLDALSIHLELPDLWQQEAVRSLRSGKSVVIDAPTGAGKTFVFELLVKSGDLKGQAIYTVPTRALANDKWREWKQAGWDVGIATGDLATNTDAPVVVATLETQREGFLNRRGPALLVVDEYQMIGDSRRGLNYELGIALSPPNTQLLLLSGSVANPGEIADWMRRLGRDVALVQTQERPVPLDDIPLQALPYTAPNSIKGFWPRAALATLMSDFGPMLIFSPHRKTAEKIAAQISESLPLATPIELSRSQVQALGPKLAKMVQNRVAFHHSGLSYAQRAGIIEPLAKAGQLRVIVATTGLAAGINFSVRSVFISETRYFEGPFEREIAPDELLQMFGRAGRRGLDENGYVLSGDRSPRLSDSRPKQLRRTNEIDWPTLLRVMHAAKLSGQSPFQAAQNLCEQLFSRQSIRLGLEGERGEEENKAETAKTDSTLFGLGPVRKEVRNSRGEWEKEDSARSGLMPLGETLAWTSKKGWFPALKVGGFMQERAKELGRLCKLQNGSDSIYGAETAVANVLADDLVRVTKRWRSLSKLSKKQSDIQFSELAELLAPVIARIEPGAELTDLQQRGRSIVARVNLEKVPVDAYQDMLDQWLIRPERRVVSLERETGYYDAEKNQEFRPPANSAAYAWRKLGLVDADGGSTRRGQIFSFFNQGEGFAVAAALEDETYPIRELAFHLANVRAGHRFESDTQVSGASERLGAICRQAYGPVDYENYLRLGLPVGFGEGAAEVVEMALEKGRAWRAETTRELGQGDVERAVVEWLSLLRHIKNAPSLEWSRWLALKEVAADLLREHTKDLQQSAEVAMIEPHILHRKVQHRISLKQANQQHKH